MPLAPYGSWRSPITADLIVSSSIGVSQPAIDGDDVYWLESRPTEGGRSVIVRRTPDGATHDVNPAPLNARTRVHEYGGGDYLVHNGTVYFANFADQRLYVARPGAAPVPLTHAGLEPPAMPGGSVPGTEKTSPSPKSERGPGGEVSPHRYADFDLDPARNRLLCVREDHSSGGEPTNTIAAIDLATGNETVLVHGHDFFAYPRLSPGADQLAWIAWDHPNMPWDGTRLYVARLEPDGSLGDPLEIAGGPTDSVLQPTWSPDGRLAFVSDLTGWWNLYLWSAGFIEPLVTTWPATRIPAPDAPSSDSVAEVSSPRRHVDDDTSSSSMPRITASDSGKHPDPAHPEVHPEQGRTALEGPPPSNQPVSPSPRKERGPGGEVAPIASTPNTDASSPPGATGVSALGTAESSMPGASTRRRRPRPLTPSSPNPSGSSAPPPTPSSTPTPSSAPTASAAPGASPASTSPPAPSPTSTPPIPTSEPSAPPPAEPSSSPAPPPNAPPSSPSTSPALTSNPQSPSQERRPKT